jgi:membrane fusion protein, multidrug efflux system
MLRASFQVAARLPQNGLRPAASSLRLHRFKGIVMLSKSLVVLSLVCGLVACTKTVTEEKKAEAPLSLGQEDVLVLDASEHGTGPVITGSVQAERRADLRAEVSAMVLRVFKENGDTVRKGDLLVSLDDSVLRDNLSSAEEASRAAGQSFDSADRQYQRQKSLQAQGMVSMQALEESEVRRNTAQSEWVAAKARIAAARQQLDRTLVRAPFDGMVSARKVSAGDTAQIGKELVQIIDPTSMRFEGMVSSDQMSRLKPGQAVSFRINGVEGKAATGKIRRIDASANPVTRQVSVLVDFTGDARPPIVGLYAEGQVETQTAQALMLPESALVREGDKVSAWLLDGQTVHKQALALGERDARLGRWVVQSGLKGGDRVVRSPGSNLKDGQAFTLRTEKTGG